MISRIEQARRDPTGMAPAVHVWGRDHAACAEACEAEGVPVVRLDSGGFFAEWNELVQQVVASQRFQVEHEVLSWQVVAWRELGRALFKDLVVDQEEEVCSTSTGWGTEDVEASYELEMVRVIRETVERLRVAEPDDVLVLCAWRVFDRQRAVLVARYGLGSTEDPREVEAVLDALGGDSARRERLRQLWIASQAWW